MMGNLQMLTTGSFEVADECSGAFIVGKLVQSRIMARKAWVGAPLYSLRDLIRARRHVSWAGRAKGYPNRNLKAGSCSASLRCHMCQFSSSGEAGKAIAV